MAGGRTAGVRGGGGATCVGGEFCGCDTFGGADGCGAGALGGGVFGVSAGAPLGVKVGAGVALGFVSVGFVGGACSPNTTCAFAGRRRTAVAQSVGAG